MNQLILGECFIELKKLIDNNIKFDAIITDPPYKMTNNNWDRAINWNEWWKLIKQLRKDEYTPIVIFGDFPFSVDLINSNRKWYRYTWYWNKLIGTGFLDSAYKPLKVIEHIHIFIEKPYKLINSKELWKKKDKKSNFYPQFSKGKANHSTGNKLAGNIGTTYHLHKTHNELFINNNFIRNDLKKIGKNENDKHPKNILEFQKVKANKNQKIHPTEKPVELLEYLVKTYTKENNIILDCFAGSGSTLVACKNLNRNYVGIELEEKYYEIAKERLSQEILFKE